MKVYYEEKMMISPQIIDSVSQTIVQHASQLKIDNKQIVQLRILTENVLIDFMKQFPADTECTIKLYRSLLKYYLSVEIAGASFNPLKQHDNAYDDEYIRMLLESVTITASYQYLPEGVNQVRLQIPGKKVSSVITSIIAIIAAFAFWAITSFLPKEIATSITDDFLTPIGSTYLKMVSTCGILMIFLSLVSTISRMSSINKLKSTGSIIVKHIMGKNLIYAFVFSTMIPFAFDVISEGTADVDGVGKRFLDIILEIIPSNIIDPFREQNALQITFIALLLGIFLLINKKRAETVIRFFDELNQVVLSIIGFICSFMPLYIFTSLSTLLLSNNIDVLTKCQDIPLVILLFMFIVVLSTKLISKFKYKVPLSINLKNSAPIGLTGFFTTSSMACLDSNRKLCLEAYDVDEGNLQFSLIFQQILYKVDCIIYFLCFVYGLCNAFGVKYSLSGYIVMSISVVLLAMAVPPVPGSTAAVLTPFLVSANLPDEAIVLFTAIFVFANMIGVGSKVFIVSDELVAMDRKIKVKK